MSNSTSNSNSKSNPEQEFRNFLEDNKSCANCGKFGANMMRCSRCKSANYCGRDCQVKHWKDHKPRCEAVQESKKLMAQQDSKRQYRLLQEWKDKIKDGLLGYLLISHYGVAQLKQIIKDRMLISMSVDFNYNQRTFLPIEPPDLLVASHLQQINPTLASAAMDQYIKCEQRVAKLNDAAAFVVMMNYKGIVSIMPILMTDVSKLKIQTTNGSSWDDIVQHLFGTVKLQKSTVFDSWIPMQQQNMKQQVNTLIRQSSHYQPFLVNALNILTTKPQHKTHIVMIQMNMGMGLGQIDKLINYQVMTVDKIKKELRQSSSSSGGATSSTMMTEYETLLDLEHAHPMLVASRQTHPNNVLLPVLFNGSKIVAYISPELMEINPGHEIISQKNSALRAQQHFAALTNITFASVTSPELH